MALIDRIAARWDWRVHAFCLMPNHHHAIVAASVDGLFRGMHALNGRYAGRYNRRHGRTGHLFQERFDARLVETDAYLEESCRYVLDNPVRAGLVDHALDWPWSGGHARQALSGG